MLSKISEKLNLTAAQKEKVKKLEADFKAKMEKMRADKSAKPDRSKMQAMFKEHMEKFMAILTPEQKTKFEALMKEMRKNRGEGPAAGAKGGKKGNAPRP